ncbi:hypothetical protein [uncultured Roseibium sp.]|uniref:hypothetical protein n=1 Tax=uncultured Roseibium sp. TaxID=1936171 RepID=UPI003216A67D
MFWRKPCHFTGLVLVAGAAQAQFIEPEIVSYGDVSCSYEAPLSAIPPITCTTDLDGGIGSAGVQNGANSQYNQAVELSVTLSGAASVTNTDSSYTVGANYSGFGLQASETWNAGNFTNGSMLEVTSDGSISISNARPGQLGLITAGAADQPFAEGGGIVSAISVGADGYSDSRSSPFVPNYAGGLGGAINLTNTGSITAATTSGPPTVVTYDNVLIDTLLLNGLGAFSLGGDGVAIKTGNRDYAGNGGDGGAITIGNSGSIDITATTVDTYGVNGIYALSQGGIGSNREDYAIAEGGDGGAVTITNSGNITMRGLEDSANGGLTGILAMSVGGNSNDYSRLERRRLRMHPQRAMAEMYRSRFPPAVRSTWLRSIPASRVSASWVSARVAMRTISQRETGATSPYS